MGKHYTHRYTHATLALQPLACSLSQLQDIKNKVISEIYPLVLATPLRSNEVRRKGRTGSTR